MLRDSSSDQAIVFAACDALHEPGTRLPSANKVRKYLNRTLPPGTPIVGQADLQRLVMLWREQHLDNLTATRAAELPPNLLKTLQLEFQAAAERVKGELAAEHDAVLVDLQDLMDRSREQEEEILGLRSELEATRSDRDVAEGALSECRQSLARSLDSEQSANESRDAAAAALQAALLERDSARAQCESLKSALSFAEQAACRLTEATAVAEESRDAALARAAAAEALAEVLQAAPDGRRSFLGGLWRPATQMRSFYRFKGAASGPAPGRRG